MKNNIKDGYPCDHIVIDSYNTLGGNSETYGVTLITQKILDVDFLIWEMLKGKILITNLMNLLRK